MSSCAWVLFLQGLPALSAYRNGVYFLQGLYLWGLRFIFYSIFFFFFLFIQSFSWTEERGFWKRCCKCFVTFWVSILSLTCISVIVNCLLKILAKLFLLPCKVVPSSCVCYHKQGNAPIGHIIVVRLYVCSLQSQCANGFRKVIIL